jgi:3-oxoacyl-[acyl-carrier-protein] synthase II
MDAERVAVTGVGVVSALGASADRTFSRLIAGDVGIGPVRAFDVGGQRCRVAAEVDIELVQQETASKSDALALLAAREALSAARHDGRGLSIVVGVTTGGMLEAERILAGYAGALSDEAARRLLTYPLSTSADRLRESLGGAVRAHTVCSACSSSASALALGATWIECGRAGAVLAGGTDALCQLTFIGFDALGVMSEGPCRPFDRRRSGLSLGEGAAFLLLEAESQALARGAPVLAWLTGWSVASEAYHITHPEPSGKTALALLTRALERAGLEPRGLDYVNAHGTGTIQNDASEARALAALLGPERERVRVSSSKGQVGHTLGAAGAVEAAFTVLALSRGIAPPTGGLEEPDPELALHYVRGRGEALELRAALSSSFGFGGSGTVLLFERDSAPVRGRKRARTALAITRALVIDASGEHDGAVLPSPGPPGTITLPRRDARSRLDPARSRRFDRASALAARGVEVLLDRAKLAPAEVGLALGSAFGNVERSVDFLRKAFARGPRFAPPADFPHLVPSAAAGNASIYAGLTGPVLAVSDLETSAEAALCIAAALLEAGFGAGAVAGSAEPEDAIVARVLGPLHGFSTPDGAERGEAAAWVVLEPEGAAEARGLRPLARLLHWTEQLSGPELPPPGDATRALVLTGAASEDLSQELARSSWRDVAVREVALPTIPAEARGGVILAHAVALLGRSELETALVLARSRAGVYAFVLGAHREPSS